MKLSLYKLRLPLAHTFSISRESIDTQNSLVVELEHDGLRGYGEVTENRFYGHTLDSMCRSLEAVAVRLDEYIDATPELLWEPIRQAVGGDLFALSALDMAAHDWHGRRNRMPTWKLWGLHWQNIPQSSFTIGIDSIDTMIAKLNEQAGWGIYKIKLGTPQDIEIVRALRQYTDAVFRVDANCGWTPQQAIENSHALAELGVEFIEQPLPNTASESDKQTVRRESALPIIADEDCQTESDVARCAGSFDGVNVKLCKCGGLTPALRMLRNAKSLGLKTMVGCMVESSIGISGAAQLLPLLDYADFDGATLLKDEPAEGVSIDHGNVILSYRDGCGGELIRDRLPEFVH